MVMDKTLNTMTATSTDTSARRGTARTLDTKPNTMTATSTNTTARKSTARTPGTKAKHDDGDEHEHDGEEGDSTHSGHDDGDEHEHDGEEEHGTHSGHEAKHDDGDEHEHDGEEGDSTHSGHDDGDEHEHADEDGDTHSEFHARYRCECNGSAIETIGVRLFEYWPRIEAIRVQALTPGGQFGGVAKADDPVIRLR